MKSEPWIIPINERISLIRKSQREGKKVAIIIYPSVDLHSSFRYRCYNVYQATKKSKRWQLIYFFEEEIDEVLRLISDIQLLIFGRLTEWHPRLDELAIKARQCGVKIALDLDDCVCGTKYIKSMFNVVSPDYTDQKYWIKTCAHIELISYLADGFIVTNEYLGRLLSKSHDGKPYRVIRNFLNEEQIEYTEHIGRSKPREGFAIGYFSGSHTHLTDFEVVFPELIRLLSEYPDIVLRIVGELELPASAEKFIKSGQIQISGRVDFLSLQDYIFDVNLNIAPLAENIFANCKSELKFFEAAIARTPTIASPNYAFAHAIKHGKTGLLCRPGEWTDAILKLYKDPEYASKLAENAFSSIKEEYFPEKVVKQIEDSYDFFTA